MKLISRAIPTRLAENELLVCCARACLNPEMTERIRALARQEIDWDYLIRAAAHHSLIPLLHWHLSATCPDVIPDFAFNQLKKYSQVNSRNNLLLTGEMIKLQRIFQSHNITVVPFKGPILAACLYGNIGLRQFGDLDLLVRKQDVPKARDLLISAGYIPRYRLNANRQAALIEQRSEEPFDRSDDAVLVDLHWAVIPPRFSFAPDTISIWQRLERVLINGNDSLTVSAEDLVMLLCVHGAKHAWERLSWICDLAELIRARNTMNWDLLIETARTQNGERILFLGLFLINDLLGVTLPAEILQRMKDNKPVKSLAAKVYANLFRRVGEQISVFERDMFYLQTMTRMKDRAHLCLDHIKPSPLEWQLLKLPGYLSILYYPLRPLRVIGKYWRDLLRGLFN